MPQEMNTVWLQDVLHEVDGAEVRQKSPRRVRVDIAPEALVTLLQLLKGKAGYLHLSSISCVDWPNTFEFELVYHVWSYETRVLASVHTRISKQVERYISVYDLYTPAGFFERDIYEMYGLYFEGSPNMEKFILTEWNGPPPMLKSFDTEQYVRDTFDWKDYNPDWLQEIIAKGGGIVE
jgi:NADH-quinone oxidoreductase subunit C